MDSHLQSTLRDRNVLIVPKEQLQQQQTQQQPAQPTPVQQPPLEVVEQKPQQPQPPAAQTISVSVSDVPAANGHGHDESATKADTNHVPVKEGRSGSGGKALPEAVEVKAGRSGSGSKSLFSIFGKKK